MTSSCNPELRDREGHARFIELCALHSSGSLERDELAELNEHLGSCQECRTLLADYRAVAEVVSIPQITDAADLEPVTGFARELAKTKRRLLSQLEHNPATSQEGMDSGNGAPWIASWFTNAREVKYAAVAILVIGVGLGGYVLGVGRAPGSRETRFESGEAESKLRTQLTQASNERGSLEAAVERQEQKLKLASLERDRLLRELSNSKQLLDQSEAGRLQLNSAAAEETKENAALRADHDGISRRLQESQANITQLRGQLGDLQSESAAFEAENSSQKNRIVELTAQMSEQQRLLAADRDIRDLMGARDLLISDVVDIDTKGRDKKPFGRIFYTKNKSLVFYAFDLDKQPGLRNAGTFQAWGTKATSHGNENPVKLGIFFMDNASARRWVVKSNDAKVLERIDSVFVTVEPEGGSNKPSGKQLLFAYLRGEANHP